LNLLGGSMVVSMLGLAMLRSHIGPKHWGFLYPVSHSELAAPSGVMLGRFIGWCRCRFWRHYCGKVSHWIKQTNTKWTKKQPLRVAAYRS
jgi:hypothetical protein